jgi:hypothetical protein
MEHIESSPLRLELCVENEGTCGHNYAVVTNIPVHLYGQTAFSLARPQMKDATNEGA